MAERANIDIDTLRQLLAYDPATGKLRWKSRSPRFFSSSHRTADGNCNNWNSRYAGTEALTALHQGYPHGDILGRKLFAHRVAYALYHGEWPAGEVDHINGDRSDNRIANLRSVDRRANTMNVKRFNTNSSGVTGVSWVARRGKWRAYIVVNYRARSLGHFTDKADAIAARKAAERELGFHPNHGRSG